MKDGTFYSNMKQNCISQKISPNDEMYQGDIEHYLKVGQSALKCINDAIVISEKNPSMISNILDLPCGYGRVLRMLKSAFPDALIDACDLLKEGVEFCKTEFGANPIHSEKNIKYVKTNKKYDLIWCGSLLTHIDANKWCDFLNFFNNTLEKNGILLFTTHGRYVADNIQKNKITYGILETETLNKMINDFELKGFGFGNYYHSGDYGISISKPSFVLKKIEKQKGLRILGYHEKGWDNHQDVITCVKNEL